MKSEHTPQFIAARDTRNRKIPGLCTRNGKFYGYLWTESESGKRSPRRFPLNNEGDGLPCSNLAEAKTALDILRGDRRENKLPEVAFREPRVLAADPHLAAEAEVVAHEDARASHKASGIRHVMAVADPHDPAEVRLPTAGQGDRHDSEVAGSPVAERMGFLKNGEPGRFQLGFHLGEDRAVAERIPGLGPAWCRHVEEVRAADDFGSAVKKHSAWSLCAECRWFDDVHRL